MNPREDRRDDEVRVAVGAAGPVLDASGPDSGTRSATPR
jgi:hypothetical protein